MFLIKRYFKYTISANLLSQVLVFTMIQTELNIKIVCLSGSVSECKYGIKATVNYLLLKTQSN